MDGVQVAHTADLDAAALRAVRDLLEGAFADDVDGGFTEEDWDHAVGGVHAIVWEGGAPIAHASVVQRRLLHAGRALRTGYVEAVAVRADRRRRGHGHAVMAAVERVVRGAYELGALGASDEGVALYRARGWRRWEGPTSALAPDGIVRTPDDDGGIYVLPVDAPLNLAGELTCDWRPGEVW